MDYKDITSRSKGNSMKKHISYDRNFRECLDIVAASCRIARKAQRASLNLPQHSKSDSTPVTAADFAIQAIINRKLGQLYKDVKILAEEDSSELKTQKSLLASVCDLAGMNWPTVSAETVIRVIDTGSYRGVGEPYWTLDPIDGTKGFIRGAQYAIALAFIDKGEVTKAIMGCPNLSPSKDDSPHVISPVGSIFFSLRGKGSWVLPDNFTSFEPEKISCELNQSNEIRICGSAEPLHSITKKNDQIAKFLNKKNHKLQLDSQCKYTIVSRGQAEAFIRLPADQYYVEKVWDHAAGLLIASEAGAIVSDADGKVLNFSNGKEMVGNKGIVCATPYYHPKIIAAIKELKLNK